MDLDVDLSYHHSPNRFRIHHLIEIHESDWEYEYTVNPAGVSARLLHCRHKGIGNPDEWEVRDGVVQEADMRAKWEKTKFEGDYVEEQIAALKRQTEWCEIPPIYWNGASYFIMEKKLSKPDSRRYFRQELERLRRGLQLATNELAKLNYKQADDGKMILLVEPEIKASQEQWNKFWETILPRLNLTTASYSTLY